MNYFDNIIFLEDVKKQKDGGKIDIGISSIIRMILLMKKHRKLKV